MAPRQRSRPVLAALLQPVFGGGNTSGVVAILEVALLVAAMVAIAVGVVDSHDVNAQSIAAGLRRSASRLAGMPVFTRVKSA